MKPIILAGGVGSRLWPKSRAALPKQFLSLTSDKTMIQETLLRLDGLKTDSPTIICNEEHRFLVAEQMRQIDIDDSTIILEPVGRNTAPAIALAALNATKNKEDPVLLVLAADHLIKDSKAFQSKIIDAEKLALEGKLVTFGIVPTEAHTGYGYIKSGESINLGFKVHEFVEKPNLSTAKQYVDSGEYFWNSGMFMFKASTFLTELEKYNPEILEACKKAMSETQRDLDFIRIQTDVFEACPDDSIDYAVMEKTDSAAMVTLDASWSDVGSWSSLWDTGQKDENGNVTVGDTLLENTKNSYVNTEHRLVSVIGLENVVVVETKDAVMVANKNDSQHIKNVVNYLAENKRPEFEFHREVFRPWGSYDSIDTGTRFKVKRITVKPNEKLSIQMHHHRAEHWVVVKGTAKVTIDEVSQIISENQSVYIPIGAIHSLENPGKIPLEIIEVQSGAYLDEDDIVRFSDRYGRTPK
ncbi:mannose-1-phosphate guanylyltransferase/mannose-6-phosphate isomerase [Alteromonas stellipolaris]|uniref:mannose-1-phosphate guanylyltransferase/mannose-6-phosphate isomerase n=1 Tax=Alteromonas stellipolaris TaxID=233316 RepID=UPI0024949E04|nr:mannose-1-phosphate guanylyltransferase/mannose-6-phosphate isomerase [Alteromonas stellipolaris]